MIFQWNDHNRRHIAKHGVTESEAEEVIDAAKPPYPRTMEDEKHLVWGQTGSGRFLQVIYIYLPDEDVDYFSLSTVDRLEFADDKADVVLVIHAMELTSDQKRLYRRLSR